MKYTTLIFDLDGTLLDTLLDLTNSVNYSLETNGFKTRTIDEIRGFVGHGVRHLMKRSLPEDVSDEEYEKSFNDFYDHYKLHCMDNTKPYPGVIQMLIKVKSMGYKTAIVSNKGQAAVDELYDLFFRDVIDVPVGNREGLRTKPSPDETNEALRLLKSKACESIYIGDSEVDIQTAENSNMPYVSVSWGFRTAEYLKQINADIIISNPEEIFIYI